MYNSASDPFDCKSILTHLRTFIESIYRELSIRIESLNNIKCNAPNDKFNEYLNYLSCDKVAFIQKSEKEFFRQFYNLMSEEGVHKFTSRREYVRICKNVAYEFGLLLLERFSDFDFSANK
jgi:hypothetical protein